MLEQATGLGWLQLQLQFSTPKTVCIHFCRLCKSHPEPQLFLNGNPVPVIEEVKFLGIIFDRKLSFLPHLRYLKNKCAKALNLLCVVAHTLWGCRSANSITSLYISHSIKIRLRLCCIWLCTRFLFTDARSYTEPCTPIMSWCFSHLSIL